MTPGVTVTFTPPGTGASGTFAGRSNKHSCHQLQRRGYLRNFYGQRNHRWAVQREFGFFAPDGFRLNHTRQPQPSDGFATQASFSLKNVDYSVAATTTTQTVKAGTTASYSLNFTTVGGNSVAATTFSYTGLADAFGVRIHPSSAAAGKFADHSIHSGNFYNCSGREHDCRSVK